MALEKVQKAIEQFEYSTELDFMIFHSQKEKEHAIIKAIQTLKKSVDESLQESTITKHEGNIMSKRSFNKLTKRKYTKKYKGKMKVK
jgi:hypothetical protein